MDSNHAVLMGFFALGALLSGSVAANATADPRTSPASQSSAYGTVESSEPDPAAGEEQGTIVAGTTAGAAIAGQEVEKNRTSSARFVIRIRLDDGRYQGFHQYGGDELRVGDRVQMEIDRLHRVQE